VGNNKHSSWQDTSANEIRWREPSLLATFAFRSKIKHTRLAVGCNFLRKLPFLIGQCDNDTKFSIPLSHRISMTSYLLSLLTVTTHTLHLVTLIKPSSSLNVTHRSFRHASPHLWNQLPTSLRIPHPDHSSPSHRPSFEHAGLTCYTLLSPSITFSLFHSELKHTCSENLILSPLTGFICLSVLRFSFIFSVLVIPMCGRKDNQPSGQLFGAL